MTRDEPLVSVSPVIIDREAACAAGLLKFYTGKPCVRGHLSQRYVSTGGCCSCLNKRFVRRINPWTAEMRTYATDRLIAPPNLTRDQRAALRYYLQMCIFQFLRHNNLNTPSIDYAEQEIGKRPPKPGDEREDG